MEYKTQDGSLSICEWQLTFTFKTKIQCSEFIKKVFELELMDGAYPTIHFYDESEGKPSYSVTIESTWAHNLLTYAEILTKLDYDYEENN